MKAFRQIINVSLAPARHLPVQYAAGAPSPTQSVSINNKDGLLLVFEAFSRTRRYFPRALEAYSIWRCAGGSKREIKRRFALHRSRDSRMRLPPDASVAFPCPFHFRLVYFRLCSVDGLPKSFPPNGSSMHLLIFPVGCHLPSGTSRMLRLGEMCLCVLNAYNNLLRFARTISPIGACFGFCPHLWCFFPIQFLPLSLVDVRKQVLFLAL